jgi:hypothetical protein
MAFAGLVDARENRSNNAKRCARLDAPCCDSLSGTHTAIGIGGCLKCAHDARADCDDAAAVAELRLRDLRRCALRDAIRLVEG